MTLDVFVPLVSTHPGNDHCSNQGALIDLAELDTPCSSSPVLAPAPAPATSGIPILPPPPQTSGPPRSRSSSQTEAPPGPESTSSALSLLDEELLCLGTCKGGIRGRVSSVLCRSRSGGHCECQGEHASGATQLLSSWAALQSHVQGGSGFPSKSSCKGILLPFIK